MSDIFANEEQDYSLDVPKEKRFLNTTSYDYSVEYLFNLIKKGKIILEVPFQRKHIWKNDKASMLIESIIMNVPIPPLYFAEEDDGSWLVLDGLQRLYSILNYYDNEFALTKVEISLNALSIPNTIFIFSIVSLKRFLYCSFSSLEQSLLLSIYSFKYETNLPLYPSTSKIPFFFLILSDSAK